MKTLNLIFVLILLWSISTSAFAGVEQISEQEFRDLAQELAPKVNLFHAGWTEDPKAEFYGGTTRDYLYWLKGQFLSAHDHAEAQAVVKTLKALPVIDVRDFIVGDSDVDVISAKEASLNADEFGVRKIDFQFPEILDPSTELGKNERLQGYIPAEKVRLGRNGFPPSSFGDGVREIYEGKLSVHFASAEDFARSRYARAGLNHPILLALRFIRLQGINYYRSYGQGFPDNTKLHAGMTEQTEKEVREIIRKAATSGELKPYLEKDKFKSWLNGGIQKSFRSYTNPTAALELMNDFGVPALTVAYPKDIDPLNQYVFAQFRDQKEIDAALAKYKVNRAQFYTDPAHFFPDGKFYHGTKTEEAFRGIVFQGIMPSDDGRAGPGLYGVAEGDKEFSEDWAGDKDRLLSFDVKPDAKIVDITQGEGLRVWNASQGRGINEDSFALKFGVDILRYPYSPQAFVVKNSNALGEANGVYRKVLGINELIEKAKTITKVQDMVRLFSVNALSGAEKDLLWNASPISLDTVMKYLRRKNFSKKNSQLLLSSSRWLSEPRVGELLKEWYLGPTWQPQHVFAEVALLFDNHPRPDRLALIDSLFRQRMVKEDPRLYSALVKHLTDLGSVQPISLDFVLGILPNLLENFNFDNPTWTYTAYVQRAVLNPAQLEKVFEMFKAPHTTGQFKAQLAIPLLEAKYKMDIMRKMLLDQARLPRSDDLGTHWVFNALEKFFPGPEVANLPFELLKERPLETLKNIYIRERLAKDERAKKFILSLLSTPDRHLEVVRTALFQYTLADKEWAALLDATVYPTEIFHQEGIAYQIPLRQEILGPESAKATLRFHLRGWEGDSMLNRNLRTALKEFPDQSVLEKYLIDFLREPRSAPELKKVFELFSYGSIQSSPGLSDAVFSYFDKFVPVGAADFPGAEWLETLDPKDEVTAKRVRRLLAENKIKIEGDLVALFQKKWAGDCSGAFTILGAKSP